MKKRASLATAILTVIASILSCAIIPTSARALEPAPEKPKITVAVSLNTSTYLPVYMALDRGFFKKEGLDVSLVTFRGGSELVKGLASGSIDIGYSGLASLSLGIAAQQKMKIFYAGNNSVEFSWYAVPSIKSFKEAKGARIGVSRYGSSTDFVTRYALKVNGLDPVRDVKIVQAGPGAARLAALEKGQLDISIFASPDNIMAEEKGYKVILSQKDLAAEFPIQTFSAMEAFIKENPNTIKHFLRAYVEAVRLSKSNRELAIKTICDHVGLQPKYAGRAYDEFINHIYEDGRWPNAKSMDVFWEMGIMAGRYKERWPLDKYFDSTFVNTYQQWKP